MNLNIFNIHIDIDDIGRINMEIYENSKYYENPCTMYDDKNANQKKSPPNPPN